ncbi:interleukin-13 receptor subunit alpha-1 isoform X1 [Alosa sapidissima]|uniref:interleukin-13 receptor subunit alpha-1 isoform X1 n=1 Tax=Alosa sapidissima TaxID=34773 RepID=UPI001C0A30B3|nr:interleukin-13 receptor subunit alpha-1 isoform X1 [Alosa sapidissima]
MSFLYWNISVVLSFCCVCMTAGEEAGYTKHWWCFAGELPAPVDAKILWESPFCPTINWTKPNISEKCVVNYTIEEKRPGQRTDQQLSRRTRNTNYTLPCMSQEEDVTFTITTDPVDCPSHRSKSKPVSLQVQSSAEVKDFRLVYYTHQTVNWTWHPLDNVTNLQSYYWSTDRPQGEVERCPQGIFRGLQLIGCHVNSNKLNSTMYVYILVNGTRGNDIINSTFKRVLKDCFKPPPPEVSFRLEGANQLELSFTKPDFPAIKDTCFDYELDYTECGKQKGRVTVDSSRYMVQYNSRCGYSVGVQSVVKAWCGSGGSEPSQRQEYGPATELSVDLVVVVCVCVLLWICALLFFYKYKERLLPKIPEPHLDSFKGLMERLYVPTPERVEISLEVCPSNTDVDNTQQIS